MKSNDAAELKLESPFRRRLWAYLQERFPPLAYGLLIVSYYSSNQFLAESLTWPRGPLHYSLASLAGGTTLLLMFLHLRLFDEHKDYADDCRHYPDRILQRGLITLTNLKMLALLAIGVELALACGWAWLVSPAPLVAVLAALFFSLLMLKEFFIGPWLRKRLLVYAISHMLILPLFTIVPYSYTTGRMIWEAPGWYWFYAFVGFFVTFNWEVSRKIRVPEDELQGVDSYTKQFGLYGAAYLVLAIRVVDTAMVALVGWHLGLGFWFYFVLVALYMICLVGFFQYRFHTSRKTARRMEHYGCGACKHHRLRLGPGDHIGQQTGSRPVMALSSQTQCVHSLDSPLLGKTQRLLGGKAANFASRLSKAGFSVPPLFVLSAEAFQYAVEVSGSALR